ncbi:MAG: response regulator transcription factor [Lachnospiraceae bacterium]|nr:response regulator transcription factor [Lachnospiraceae bacterium]MDE6621193.1 response regulator transcription factor [Lachnospiraceae bacterium]
MAHILVIDDEKDICCLIERVLGRDGHTVTAKNSAAGLTASDLNQYDLLLLDVMMPGIDGFSFCYQIRRTVDCPILFLTAKTMEQDIVEGFAVGADDYIKKPFGIAELRARVAAHLRREGREHHQTITSGRFHFDLSARVLQIKISDTAFEEIPLTRSEYQICEYLVRNKGQVFSLEKILEETLGYDSESDVSAIRMHIKNIRSKFAKYSAYAECPISTVWGVGYKWQ